MNPSAQNPSAQNYPARAAQFSGPHARLAAELRTLGHRLDAMATELLHLQPAAGAEPAPAAGGSPRHDAPGRDPSGAYPPAPYPPFPYPPAPYPPAGHPPPAYPRAAVPPWPYSTGPVPPLPSAPPRPAGARRAGAFSGLSGARLLAWTGGAVTLLGVVMLLVLAASRGWFSPPARVGAGAVLGVALVGLGVWLHRRESARTGARALAATGFATLYLVVAAATAVYGYLDPVPALALALLVGAAGLGLADRWRTELLAGGVVVGAALLAPALATDRLLVALVLALQLAALPVVLRRRWPVLMLLAAAGPVLYGSVVGVLDAPVPRPSTIAVVLGVLAVGIGTAFAAGRSLPTRAVAALVGAIAVPVLVTGTALGGWGGAAVIATAAVAMTALAAWPDTGRVIRRVAAAVAALALFQATAVAVDGSTATAVVLGEAIVAAVLAYTLRLRFPLVVGLVFGALGVAGAVAGSASPAALLQFPADAAAGPVDARTLVTGAVVSALILVLAIALLGAGGRVGWIRPDTASAGLWVPIGLAGLYGATSLVVTLALLVAPDRGGFTAGHALATVSWTVGALVLLARGIGRRALRIAGLVLVAAAVAKLVLFDLVALDDIARVAAFLGAGLVLLTAGTRYARLVTEAGSAGIRTIPAETP